ncbi:unnamed protein product [Symbiodinium sp. CCMP2592]|nr:unnamed protein product [Symbiodinium sp. CCMP2592]
MSMRDETRRRLSIAKGSFDAGRKLLYQNKTISLKIRASLFAAAILPSFFNLSLWEPQGEHDVLWVPLPIVHLMTGCWPLDLEAVKSRLGLLCSLVAVNPAPLWALLQTEQTWVRALRADLQLVVDQGGTWPAFAEEQWPRWWHMMKYETVAFKRMFRRAASTQPRLDLVEAHWYCRPCGQGFRNKAGLEAQAKLYLHLRDSPGCVRTLRHHGFGAATAPPGQGSRAWRKKADEEFTLAIPQQVCDPLPPCREGKWDDVQLAAYADLCNLLFQDLEWSSKTSLVDQGEGVLAKFPLYKAEEGEVLRYVLDEVRLLRADDPDYPWSPEAYDNLIDTLAQIDEMPTFVSKTEEDEASEAISYRRFADVVSQEQWDKIHLRRVSSCVTPAQPFELLDASWEAELLTFSDDCSFSATISSALLCVPKPVRDMWEQVIQGRVSSIWAPSGFWQSPFAAPFKQLRAVPHA